MIFSCVLYSKDVYIHLYVFYSHCSIKGITYVTLIITDFLFSIPCCALSKINFLMDLKKKMICLEEKIRIFDPIWSANILGEKSLDIAIVIFMILCTLTIWPNLTYLWTSSLIILHTCFPNYETLYQFCFFNFSFKCFSTSSLMLMLS